MSQIDCITAVLSIPTVEEDGELRDARPGEALLDEHFAQLGERFSAMNTAEDNQPCTLETLLAEFLGQPVAADAVDFTYYEKKGLVYPAIVFNTVGLTRRSGEPLAGLITERFRDDTARTELAGLLGQALQVDWVSIFTTFGAAAPARHDDS
jgi:hypothetical protein